MKVLSVIVFNAILSFFVALFLLLFYGYFNIEIAFPFGYYWACAFFGCITYDCIKYSLTKKKKDDEE